MLFFSLKKDGTCCSTKKEVGLEPVFMTLRHIIGVDELPSMASIRPQLQPQFKKRRGKRGTILVVSVCVGHW